MTGEMISKYMADRHVYGVGLLTPDGRRTVIRAYDELGVRLVSLSDEILSGHSEIYFYEI